ncbi:hypothetical protein J2T12_002799 [Paenibacillus anaericanus]|uniref:DUF2628 domain-containing protein n=1 Tax=Paenibacillus anaericanus TaxID=170367 RepID=UPI002788D342|nr:DUF2628 domain-containing protein [Paenibacillus anaericanus]MDQ0089387.1 hypothetical protein [Paenibacillus anaericanus]
MYCYNCGTLIYEDDKFCVKCGSPKEARHEVNIPPAAILRSSRHTNSTQNEPMSADYSRALELFVGPQADVYARKWKQGSRWNWPAFLFGGYWMLYRGMYLYLLIYLISEALILNIVGSLFPRFSFRASMVIVMLLTNLVIKIGLTVVANTIYLHHARRKINAIQERYRNDTETADAKIVLAGETSLYIPIALAVLPILIALVYGLYSFLHMYNQINQDFPLK